MIPILHKDSNYMRCQWYGRTRPETHVSTRCAIPLADQEGTVHPHFGEAPFYGIYTLENKSGTQTHREVISIPRQSEKKGVDIIVIREPLTGKGQQNVAPTVAKLLLVRALD